ncbi:MAG: T9SS type A sorting domain-containing protein [Bacteroidales bacterium]|nr:T9SS type A sorting domain-containing protein [Bacteroidales bacterium]
MFRVFVIFLLSVCFSLLSFSRNLSDNDRVRDLVNRYGQTEIYVPYSDYRTLDYLSEKVSVLNVTDKIIEISLSKLTVEWFLSQKYSYSIKEKPDLKGILSSGAQSKAFVWDSYPTYTQYDSLMQSFELNYPTLCRLDTIGTSVNGRMVFALKISDNPGADEAEPSVFYTSTMHGDETGGFMMMLRLADFLLKNYSEDAQVKELTDNLQIWINPLANPDGTYNSGNSISSPVRYNALGKDLNRDFPDPTLIDTQYAKENIDMIRFMRKHRFVISANFHSGNEVVNYPWDRWLTKFHADDTWFYEISRAYADTVHIYSDPDYMRSLNNGVTRGSVWYVIKGGRQDFMTQELHGREVTIEVDDQYVTPADQLSALWENNRHSLLGYLENALYGIHGVVLDSESYAPVPAEVFIKGHDKDSSQVYADTLTGHFVRMIYPGIWPLTFSASGYRDTTINVAANDRQKTDITVYMVKGTIPPDSLLPEPPALYPNPASSVINAVLTDDVTGSVNVMIINSSGKVMLEYDTEAYSDIPLIIDISRLASGIYSAVFTNSRKKSSCRGRFIVIK